MEQAHKRFRKELDLLVGRVLATVGRSRRALVLGLLGSAVLALPITAHGERGGRAVVPSDLLSQAEASPDRVFAVIVQGTGGRKSADVASGVAAERTSSPGKGRGVKRRFATISGVSAELTGRQILKLAEKNWVLAITRDAPVVPVQDGEPLPADPVPPVEPTTTTTTTTTTTETPPATTEPAPTTTEPAPTVTEALPPPPPPPPLVLPPPLAPATVTGNAVDGETLVAAHPLATGYAWERCGRDYGATVAADGPAARWTLDAYGGVDGATADSTALEVADGGGIDVEGVTNATFASAFTLEAWGRVVAPPTDKGRIGKWRWLDGGGGVRGSDPAGRYALAVGRDHAEYLFTPVVPSTGAWEHIVGTWDGSTLRLYRNGEQIGEKPFAGTVGDPTSPFQIGKYGDPKQYLDGAVDDAAVYSRALSPAQVREHSDAGCRSVAGASGASYVLGPSDVGARVRVRASSGTEAAVSPATAPVALAPPRPIDAPALDGRATETLALAATSGSWGGSAADRTYRWQRCDATGTGCADIAGAAGASYVLGAEDVGSSVRVVVTAANSAGSAEAASAPTGVVAAAAPTNVVPPAVVGVTEDGANLTASTGTWEGLELTGRTVRWLRCDAVGASCQQVATDEAYALSEADVGTTIRAAVVVENAAGMAFARSQPSPVVSDAFASAQQWPSVVGAPSSWSSAKSGLAQPAIAIVDSGIDAGRVDFGGRVVHEVTLATAGANSPGDGRGHGTFVASVAAGEAAGYAGVAPNAKLVSVDVLDDAGRATMSDVIAAADWIYNNRATYGIRVANFSLHGTARSSFTVDPLDKAVEKLWHSGVVVVAAAGNYAESGAASGVPFSPANDPFVITVGATDTLGTLGVDDDVTAPWSSWGYTADGFAKPELSAPGRYVVGAVPDGSTLATERPSNVVAPGYMQLSGTSFAAAAVSGAAAHLLALRPEWTPNQVKGALIRGAAQLPAATPRSGGLGQVALDGAAAVASPPNPNAALDEFLVPDPAGGPEPVFDSTAWAGTVQANEFWGSEFWGSEFWGSEFWGSEFWGSAYWEPQPAADPATTPDEGTATSSDNARADWLPAGGYWLNP